LIKKVGPKKRIILGLEKFTYFQEEEISSAKGSGRRNCPQSEILEPLAHGNGLQFSIIPCQLKRKGTIFYRRGDKRKAKKHGVRVRKGSKNCYYLWCTHRQEGRLLIKEEKDGLKKKKGRFAEEDLGGEGVKCGWYAS